MKRATALFLSAALALGLAACEFPGAPVLPARVFRYISSQPASSEPASSEPASSKPASSLPAPSEPASSVPASSVPDSVPEAGSGSQAG